MELDQMRGNKYPFFPEYDSVLNRINEWTIEIRLTTTIRKQDRKGIWFLWDVDMVHREDSTLPITDILAINKATKEFISRCYQTIMLGIVDPNLEDFNGNKIFKRDPNQESETERLSRLANGK